MLDTRALSPEVKKLLELVKNQANDYVAAYDLLNKEIKTLQHEKHEVNEASEQMQTNVTSSINKLENLVKNSIDELKDISKEALGMHKELNTVIKIREELQDFIDEVTNKSEELSKSIYEFKLKSEKELGTTLENLVEKIQTEFEKEAQKIEVRISVKLKSLETKLPSYDQKLAQMAEAINREYRGMLHKIDGISQQVGQASNFKEEVVREVLNQFHDIEAENETKFEEINKKLEKIVARIKEMRAASKNNSSNDDDGGEGESSGGFGSLSSIAGKLKKVSGSNEPNYTASSGGNSNLDGEVKRIAKSMEEFTALKEKLSENALNGEKRGNIAIIMASIALIGIILLLIFSLQK